MEFILLNPGLQHITENILWNLKGQHLRKFAKVNQMTKKAIQNPYFALSKFENLSKHYHNEWLQLIRSNTSLKKGICIIDFLIWNFENKNMKLASNSPDDNGRTPIHWAAFYGYSEIMTILIANSQNPITRNVNGETPIHFAAKKGHKKIVEHLILLTDIPNDENINGMTPFEFAKRKGYFEITKILKERLMNIHLEKRKRKTIAIGDDEWMTLHDVKKLKKEEKDILKL